MNFFQGVTKRMSSLLELPKEIIAYILSYVAVDVYFEHYTVDKKSWVGLLKLNERLNWNPPFDTQYKSSRMGTHFIHKIRLIHPKFDKILRNACVWKERRERGWTFKHSFFLSIKNFYQLKI